MDWRVANIILYLNVTGNYKFLTLTPGLGEESGNLVERQRQEPLEYMDSLMMLLVAIPVYSSSLALGV